MSKTAHMEQDDQIIRELSRLVDEINLAEGEIDSQGLLTAKGLVGTTRKTDYLKNSINEKQAHIDQLQSFTSTPAIEKKLSDERAELRKLEKKLLTIERYTSCVTRIADVLKSIDSPEVRKSKIGRHTLRESYIRMTQQFGRLPFPSSPAQWRDTVLALYQPRASNFGKIERLKDGAPARQRVKALWYQLESEQVPERKRCAIITKKLPADGFVSPVTNKPLTVRQVSNIVNNLKLRSSIST